MKMNKKLILLTALTFSSLYIEAKPGQLGAKNDKQEMISMDQLQEMEQMQQMWNLISVMMTVKFNIKFPKFRSSIVTAYKKDPKAVENEVIKKTDGQFDSILAEVVKEIEIDKELIAMLSELKPLLKQMFAQEVMKWVHITASSGIEIQ